METVRLGDSDLEVSRVGLGCNNFGGRIGFDETRAVVEAALEAGVTFFDTAETYGNGGESERFLGEILEARRGDVVLATKFGWGRATGNGSAEAVRTAIVGSLDRLRTDYVDLYYLHKPDPATPVAETLHALDELVTTGTVRAIGICNASAEQLAEADRVARELGTSRFVVVQNEYSLLERDDDADVLPLCRELGISYVPYFPLASGLLTGKYRRGEPAPEGTRLAGREIPDERLRRVEAFGEFAKERGHTLLELAISALASIPGLGSIIAGATKPEQVRANVGAAGWRLTVPELDDLARV
jgi:aryl-alcohol dehydrogenase-like predicted oxidoreductase